MPVDDEPQPFDRFDGGAGARSDRSGQRRRSESTIDGSVDVERSRRLK